MEGQGGICARPPWREAELGCRCDGCARAGMHDSDASLAAAAQVIGGGYPSRLSESAIRVELVSESAIRLRAASPCLRVGASAMDVTRDTSSARAGG